MSADSFRVDKVGGSDGALEPNGVPDAVFQASVEGPVIGIGLLARDANDAVVGQWDTLTGADKFPEGQGLLSPHGDSTPGLVLEEGGRRLNHNDGSIPPLLGRHELKLYAEVRDVDSARTVQLIALTSSGHIVLGPRIAFGANAPKPSGATPVH